MNGFVDEFWCSECNNVYKYELIYDYNENDKTINEIRCPKCQCSINFIEPSALVRIIECKGQLEDIEGLEKND